MYYCPYCGTSVKEDEHFCIHCGEKLPIDIEKRLYTKKQISKYWKIPPIAIIVTLVIVGAFQLILQNKTTQVQELYNQGENEIIEGNYEDAIQTFEKALTLKEFPEASTALEFLPQAIKTEESIDKSMTLSNEQNYQEALTLLNAAENKLNHYHGDAVNDLIDRIQDTHDTLKVAQLSSELEANPSIDELKVLLWDADAVGKEARDITEKIRNQIVEYSFSEASELINENQFSDAHLIVEDALKYAPDSDKLNSLKTTIDKEKTAFETAQQQRIEQAMSIAQADQEWNENDAVDLKSTNVTTDDNGNYVISGEVKSVATIPIHSILIEYSLLNKNGDEILSNEIFVYPDKLYPEESGNFEFTHYDLDKKDEKMELEVNKITWYTD